MSSDDEDLDRTSLERSVLDTRLRDSHNRRFIYADVENLVTTGFLHMSVEIGQQTLTLRSLSGMDQTRLWARTALARTHIEFSRWLIASSVWMIDGLDVSLDVNAPYHIMNDLVRSLRAEYISVLMCSITSLRKRTERAMRLVEAFCYEPYGRAAWRMNGKQTPTTNTVRSIWVAHNITEDERLDDNRLWSHTRAQVASMTSKGAKHLAQAEERIREKEENRRLKVVRDSLLWVYYGDRQEAEAGTPVLVEIGGETYEVTHVNTAETPEELEAEMNRWARGEKDLHDLLVEEYLQNIRNRVEQQREERQRALEEARGFEDAIEGATGGIDGLVGYTAEQLAELGVKAPSGTKQQEESVSSSYLYDRYMKDDINIAGLDGQARPIPMPSVAPVVPQDDEETLQEKIAKRRPSLDRLSGSDT